MEGKFRFISNMNPVLDKTINPLNIDEFHESCEVGILVEKRTGSILIEPI